MRTIVIYLYGLFIALMMLGSRDPFGILFIGAFGLLLGIGIGIDYKAEKLKKLIRERFLQGKTNLWMRGGETDDWNKK